MKKAAIAAAGVAAVVLLQAGTAVRSASEFYAVRVVDHINVNAPGNATGRPDGRFAEIKPDGEMTLRMESALRFLEGSDDGFLVVKAEGEYGLAGLFELGDEGGPAWLPLGPGSGPGRFKLGTMRFSPAQSTDTIRIVNGGARPVYLDAVAGIGEKP